jgi:hypothetical protein
MLYLVVVRPFGPYRVGDVISDDESIRQILASDHATNVVRVHPPSEV